MGQTTSVMMDEKYLVESVASSNQQKETSDLNTEQKQQLDDNLYNMISSNLEKI